MNDQIQKSSSENSNYGRIILNIFSDPGAAFESIKQKPNWLIPLIIILFSSYIFSVLTLDIQLQMQKEFILDSSLISEDQKDAQLEQLDNPSFYMENISPVISSLTSTFFITGIIAAIFLVFGNFVFGQSEKYVLNFSAVAWCGLIGVLEGFIKLPLILDKSSLEVYTSLALLMDLDQSKTFLFQFLNIFDVFTVWKVIVYSTAFMVIYNISRTKSYATVITLTLIVSFSGIGLAQLFYN